MKAHHNKRLHAIQYHQISIHERVILGTWVSVALLCDVYMSWLLCPSRLVRNDIVTSGYDNK